VLESLLWIGASSFVLSLVLTPICRDVFRSYGVVDRPDQARKLHQNPIPRTGGIAIAISYSACFLWIVPRLGGLSEHYLQLVRSVLPAAGVVFLVGLIDDLVGLKPWQKLIGQLGGAGLAYAAGVRVSQVGGYSVESWWTLLLTLFWLLACTNAFNLVDGLDGLAAGIGLFATITIFLAALLQKNPALALATVPLAGCLLGFLCYNFNPATIFLGDSGSLLLGFLLGCYGVIWSQKSVTLLGMTAPVIALSIPLLDTSLAVVRRLLGKRPVFGADRGHIHHRLLDQGRSPRRVVLIFYSICGLAAVFSLLTSVVRNNRISGAIILLFCAVTWLGIQYLGYAEFGLTSRLLFRGGFQRSVDAQIQLRHFQESLAVAKNVQECWQVIRDSARIFGFDRIRLRFSGESFEEDVSASAASRWHLRVPLPDGDYVEFYRGFQSPVPPMVAGLLVDTLSEALTAKLAEFRSAPSSPTVIVPEHDQ
jgi:UDP-GlcNAc:undecaprenyl-phosphate GlcNAc-1-phosphate transferase